jgi:cyanate permease
VNLYPARAGVAIVLDQPAQQALANAKFAGLLCALPVL